MTEASRSTTDTQRTKAAAVFDRLVASNLALTESVATLVSLTKGVLAFNLLFLTAIIVAGLAVLWRH